MRGFGITYFQDTVKVGKWKVASLNPIKRVHVFILPGTQAPKHGPSTLTCLTALPTLTT